MEANKAEPSSRRAPGTSYIKAEVSEVEARQQTNISEMPAGSTPSPRSRRAKHQDHRVRRAAREPNPFPSHKSPEQRATPKPHKKPFQSTESEQDRYKCPKCSGCRAQDQGRAAGAGLSQHNYTALKSQAFRSSLLFFTIMALKRKMIRC